ncbi:MAG: hypothetical protein VW947_03010 [Gammaproteobacteria bacterium]
MINILSFDSIYILSPIRKFYLFLIKRLFLKNSSSNKLIIYRLDKENIFIRNNNNLSGSVIGINQDQIDALSIRFYHFLESSSNCGLVTIKGLPLYGLYQRQVKLKLSEVLKCAFRINNLSYKSDKNLEILTDRQTASILKSAFLFLKKSPSNIIWNESSTLTACITFNALLMRIAALIKMLITPSTLPNKYFIKETDKNLPTVLLALPRRRPEDFLATYVEDLEENFNIIFYAHGDFKDPPEKYQSVGINRNRSFLKGVFNLKSLYFNTDSYLTDILVIFKHHFNLGISVDVVEALYSNEIDVLINRQQTNVIDNYLAIEARNRGVFILGDIFEEIFFCDSAICSSESQNNDSVKLALPDSAKISYRGSNSLIKYRLKAFSNKDPNYIKNLLGVDKDKRVIFYASDPSKEESQRYLVEMFLMKYFSLIQDHVLVIKTHTQDDGKITHYSYLDAKRPENIFLIGDKTQKGKLVSDVFNIFEEFDFNNAISSSDGFLTSSSSSILQALVLGVKTGIVDKFNNGYYDYLIKYNASNLINDKKSLDSYLNDDKKVVTEEVLAFCGLQDKNNLFDLNAHLVNCLNEFNKAKGKQNEKFV